MKNIYKLCLSIVFVINLISTLNAHENLPINNLQEKELSAEDKKIIKEETLRKVKELAAYIKTIMDKSIANKNIQSQAVSDAVSLFQSEDNVVQVSNLNSTSISELKVRQYFNKIRILNYAKIEIKWYDITYYSDLHKGPDGKYYGIVTVFQKFTGYNGDGNMVYSDITQKNIEIIVEINEDPLHGLNWKVFLGNISVIETT